MFLIVFFHFACDNHLRHSVVAQISQFEWMGCWCNRQKVFVVALPPFWPPHRWDFPEPAHSPLAGRPFGERDAVNTGIFVLARGEFGQSKAGARLEKVAPKNNFSGLQDFRAGRGLRSRVYASQSLLKELICRLKNLG